MTLHHRYTLPPKQAKIVLKSVFLNKINTLHFLWSSCDSPHFGHQNFYDPPYFSIQECMTPSIFGTPSQRK